jgi:hypothetical protein
MNILIQYTEELHWFLPYENICILSNHPVEIHRNNNGLHCDTGAALKYADGYSLWSLNGVKVTEEIVKTPWNKLDARIILKEQNAEIKRELVRKIGIEKVCKDLNAIVIDKKDNYELLNLDLGDKNFRPYLKMKNPSLNLYCVEGVPIDCKTVDDALFSRRPTEMKKISIDNKKGDEWFQQGDVCIWNKQSKYLKQYPKILT